MYRNVFIRIGCLLLFGVAVAESPAGGGYPWIVDGWLWMGIRDLTTSRQVPMAVSALMVAAAIVGRWLPSCAITVRRPVRWALVLALACGAAFWLLRVRVWYGDLVGIDQEPLPFWTVETAEPLGAYTFYYTMHAAAALGIKGSTALALVSTVMGAAALVAIFLWARLVTAEWPLLLAMFTTSGFMLMFCGYPEKGTPKSLPLMCWYVYFGTRELRERRPWLQGSSGLFLSLALLMHGSVLCWLPAHAWYVWRRAPWRQAAFGIAAFLLPLAAILCYALWLGPPCQHPGSGYFRVCAVGGPWGNVAAPWQWFKQYCITNCGYDFWSLGHAIDTLNCLLVLAPVALLCFPEALARSRDDLQRWLALGALGCVFLSATWFPVFGYVRDWDIFAITPLALSYHAGFIAASDVPAPQFRSLALAWIAGSALHAASWWRFFHVIALAAVGGAERVASLLLRGLVHPTLLGV